MVNDVPAIDSTPGESAAVASGRRSSTDTAPVAEYEWLVQATRLRSNALRFARDRIERDLAAGRLDNDIDPDGPTAGIDGKPMLTAEYLAENERMADLMRDLARRGLLAPLRR